MSNNFGSERLLPSTRLSRPVLARIAAAVAFVGLCGVGAAVSHLRHHKPSAYAFLPQMSWQPFNFSFNLGNHSRHDVEGNSALYFASGDPAPFNRRETRFIVKRWKAAGPVEVNDLGPVYTSKYATWRQRALAQVALLQDEGRASAARNAERWLESYENHEAWRVLGGDEPVGPRVTPASLTIAAGGPAPAAFRGDQNEYTVTLPGVTRKVVLRDHPVDPDYPYLINPTGVADEGTVVSKRPDATKILRQAKLGHEARLIFLKVSQREGGFEAVNTYDTGYVSVGFIQFATMQSGTGSLVKVLEAMRLANRKEYEHYFVSFGIDVDEDNALTVVQPDTGTVLHGPDAVDAVQHDKRLIAVFYHAGQGSQAFAAAQVAAARSQYYAPEHKFSIPVARVVDYSDPWNPVSTYYYGDDAIASAEQTAATENSAPWTPPGPKPVPVVPKLATRAFVLPHDSAAQHSKARVVDALDVPRLPVPGEQITSPDEQHQRVDGETDEGEGQDAPTPSASLDQRNSVRETADNATTPKSLPAIPFVSGAPTKRQVRRSMLASTRIAPPVQTAAPQPYTGPHFKFERLPNLEGAYGEVFRSDAGRTAITDRCIQRGFDIGPKHEGLLAKFTEAVGLVAPHDHATVQSLARNEAALISVVQNRILVFADPDLGQPADRQKELAKANSRTRTGKS